MAHLDFELRFVSPAFLGAMPDGVKLVRHMKKNRVGPPTEESAEPPYYPVDPLGVRIPSLRGVLEFWYRALHGQVSPSQVFERQEAVFGSARSGQGIRLRPLGAPHFKSGELRFGGHPRHSFVYLGYGPLQPITIPHPRWRDGEPLASTYNKNQCRDAVLIEGEPSRFSFRAEGTPLQRKELRRALVLLHLFGGLGSRSRRGWGSVEVGVADLEAPPSTGTEDWVRRLLQSALGETSFPPPTVGQLPQFSALGPQSRIYVTKPLSGSYESVLLKFHEHFKRVRAWISDDRSKVTVADHDLELADAQNPGLGVRAVPARLAFGMPYSPKSKSKDWNIEYIGRVPGQKDDVLRRASPLFLKVHRLGKDLHLGIALFLESKFFGDPKVEIGAKGMPLTQPFPGYDAVLEFFDSPDWRPVGLP